MSDIPRGIPNHPEPAISQAGMAYVLGALNEQPIPPNGFSYPGMRAAVAAYLEDSAVAAALEALFDEGVNFADYDEGHFADEPDGYDAHAGGANKVEVRSRAVARALDVLTPSKPVDDIYACGECGKQVRRSADAEMQGYTEQDPKP